MERRRFSVRVLLALTATVTIATVQVRASHFRGGTISWRSEGGNKVHFYYRLGWTYRNGPGCQTNLTGQLVTGMSGFYWNCQSGNCGTAGLHNVNYYCTGASQAEDWEQGKNDFTYTFPGTGPFTIGFTGGAWIRLSSGKGGRDWNVGTIVDLRTRSDTAAPNSSPESQSKPMYYVPFDCEVRLQLPVVDADDDTIRCRWARGGECKSVCTALPFAHLDEETCTLVFNTTQANNYVKNGVYAVAVTIEDFPKVPITFGGSTKKTPSDALSAVGLQFLVTTIPSSGSCDAGPRFVPPTPKEKEVIIVEEGDTALVDLYTDNGNDTSAKATVITASGPVTMTQSPVVPDVNRTQTFTTTISWKTKHTDLGNNIVCANVANDKGKSGEQRCFVIKVVPKGCKSSPCQNNGKCVANMGNYACICRPGFSGKNCDVNIDDCVSKTCPSGTYCLDGINAYTCPNVTTTTTTTQMTTPRFVPPTPKEKEVIIVEEGDIALVNLYTDNGNDTSAKATVITASGPVTMTQSPVVPDVNRTQTFTTTVSWKTKHTDLGNNIVCANVANDKGKSGEQRCFVIKVVPKGCKSSPCQNSGKCVANMGHHTCICRPGFSGKKCDVNIDDCVLNTCPSGTVCLDGVNAYTCPNVTTTTTTTQMTTTEKNYIGMCPLEYEHCDCVIRPNRNDRGWMVLSRIERDALVFFFGVPIGLVLSVFAFFCVGQFRPRERRRNEMRDKITRK